MIKVGFARGAFLNNYETQNYFFDPAKIKITGISSLFPIHNKFSFPTIKFLSLSDVPQIFPSHIPFLEPGIRAVSNRAIGDQQVLFGLEKVAKNFDIFHCGDPHYYYSYQLARLRKSNRIFSLIVTSWETIPFNNETIFQKKRIKYFVLQQADRFICHTDKARQVLVKEGVDTDKIISFRLGVDLGRFKPERRKKEKITLLFVGRLVEEKGILDAYKAYRFLVRDFKEEKQIPNFFICGEGYLHDRLTKIIREDGLQEKVKLVKADYLTIHKLYQKSDIFILPSKQSKTWEEQYGMALIEAMACGLPIVTTNSGAIGELVKDAGLLVSQSDTVSISKALRYLVKNRTVREKIGKMGRERAEHEFDRKKTAKIIESSYVSIYESNRNHSFKG